MATSICRIFAGGMDQREERGDDLVRRRVEASSRGRWSARLVLLLSSGSFAQNKSIGTGACLGSRRPTLDDAADTGHRLPPLQAHLLGTTRIAVGDREIPESAWQRRTARALLLERHDVIVARPLDAGTTYRLHELKPPAGYRAAADKDVTTVAGEISAVVFRNRKSG